jgi:hypothetical protein
VEKSFARVVCPLARPDVALHLHLDARGRSGKSTATTQLHGSVDPKLCRPPLLALDRVSQTETPNTCGMTAIRGSLIIAERGAGHTMAYPAVRAALLVDPLGLLGPTKRTHRHLLDQAGRSSAPLEALDPLLLQGTAEYTEGRDWAQGRSGCRTSAAMIGSELRAECLWTFWKGWKRGGRREDGGRGWKGWPGRKSRLGEAAVLARRKA